MPLFSNHRLVYIIFIFALVLSGCAGPVATHNEALQGIKGEGGVDNETQSKWAARDNDSGVVEGNFVDDGWLKSFDDEQLDKLVDEALANNPDLKISRAKVEQARSEAKIAGAYLKPDLDLKGNFSDRNNSGFNDIAHAVVSASWEPDVWGRIAANVASAEEKAQASALDYRFARLSIVASVSNSWFLAIESKLQHQFALEVKEIRQNTLDTASARYKVGRVDKHEVFLAKADLAAASGAEKRTQSAMEDSARSLELLLGRYPAAEIEITDELMAMPPSFPLGVPSQILERRPDLVAAENLVAAAFYKEEEAKLLHLPRFTFSLGLGANTINNSIASLAAGIFAPLYTGGEIEAEVERATAIQKEAIHTYAQAALQAFREVESALAAEKYLAERQKYMQLEVEKRFKAYTVMMTQYKVGMISLVDTLTVQTQWVAAKISLINLIAQHLTNRVQLHLALGGSFAE